MAKKTIAKSAETGKIVSKKFAKENPATTFETPIEMNIKPKKAKEITFLPMVGEKFDLDGMTVEVVSFDPLQVIEHKIVGGCQTQWKLLVDNIDGAKPLTREEAFIRLA